MGLTFFHAISSDIIRNFHTLCPHILWKSLTLFHTLYGILCASVWSTFPHEFQTVWNMKKPWYHPTIT